MSISAPVFVEASELGDLLATAGVETRLGVETPDEGSNSTDSACLQSATFPFFMSLSSSTSTPVPEGSDLGIPFSLGRFSWSKVWTYRRSFSATRSGRIAVGDTTQQNWGQGNDYIESALFLDENQSPWAGGLNITALSRAEQRAFGWYHWYANNVPSEFTGLVRMNQSSTGTQLGLSKMPYLRDSRRPKSGLNGFMLEYSMLQGGALPDDTIALGNYPTDIHPLEHGECHGYPSYVNSVQTQPFGIPFRAIATDSIPNLPLSGKSMAVSFHANAATRVHPAEWSTGVAAGAAASLMAMQGWTKTTRSSQISQSYRSCLGSPTLTSH